MPRMGSGTGTGNRKSYLGRVEYMLSPGGDVHLSLGGNVFGNAALKALSRVRPMPCKHFVGAFGALSVGQFTLFGETDWVPSQEEARHRCPGPSFRMSRPTIRSSRAST